MSSITASPQLHLIDAGKRRRSVLIVVMCTLIIPAAQYLIKLGANQLAAQHLAAAGAKAGSVSFQAAILGIFTNPAIFSGYCLYGVFTILFVFALKHGELSILYPLISLSYVWVAIIAVLALHEAMNPYKLVGIAIIVSGVTVLGRGSSK